MTRDQGDQVPKWPHTDRIIAHKKEALFEILPLIKPCVNIRSFNKHMDFVTYN